MGNQQNMEHMCKHRKIQKYILKHGNIENLDNVWEHMAVRMWKQVESIQKVVNIWKQIENRMENMETYGQILKN